MDAIKYLEERKRMIEHTAGKEKKTSSCYDANCGLCPLGVYNNPKGKPCRDLEANFPEEAIAIVEKWSEENPQRTMLQDLLEKHPNATMTSVGTPATCAYYLGYVEECKGPCEECWNRPLK